ARRCRPGALIWCPVGRRSVAVVGVVGVAAGTVGGVVVALGAAIATGLGAATGLGLTAGLTAAGLGLTTGLAGRRALTRGVVPRGGAGVLLVPAELGEVGEVGELRGRAGEERGRVLQVGGVREEVGVGPQGVAGVDAADLGEFGPQGGGLAHATGTQLQADQGGQGPLRRAA